METLSQVKQFLIKAGVDKEVKRGPYKMNALARGLYIRSRKTSINNNRLAIYFDTSHCRNPEALSSIVKSIAILARKVNLYYDNMDVYMAAKDIYSEHRLTINDICEDCFTLDEIQLGESSSVPIFDHINDNYAGNGPKGLSIIIVSDRGPFDINVEVTKGYGRNFHVIKHRIIQLKYDEFNTGKRCGKL